jgi:tRNA(Arg) A34 adenosine deaminase TadA
MTSSQKLAKHQILSEAELDDAVHAVQLDALARGMIPISAIVSRPAANGKHEVLGFGNNRLADGVPGIHGETGAVIDMGRLEGGYSDLVVTSSLSPCPFCQCLLSRQLGIRTVRILDAKNYVPDQSDYLKAGIRPAVASHAATEATFEKWVTDPANSVLWNRDIGIPTGPRNPPKTFSGSELDMLMRRAVRLAEEAEQSGEAPIGALVVDEFGQVAGCGASTIVRANDPSMVAAMAAWRASGSRDDLSRMTLVLTSGPDHIAYSMFKIFGFGQLVVGSTSVYAGQAESVKGLGKPVVVVVGKAALRSDQLLTGWLQKTPSRRQQEYLGADWKF